MNRIQIIFGALTALLLVPAASFAAPPPAELRYDFVGLGLTFGEVDTVGDDSDFTNFTVGGSWGFHENFALFGRVSGGEVEAIGDVDTSQVSIGINSHFPITDTLDIVIPVAIEWADFDGPGFSDDDTGYSLGVGVRALLSPAWELSGGIQHVDVFGSDQSLYVNARWHMTSLFSMGLGGEFGDDVSAILLDARFSF